MASQHDHHPLMLIDRETDAAIAGGWERFLALVDARDSESLARGLVLRLDEAFDFEELTELVAAIADAASPEERAMAAAELAELVEPVDSELAAVCWDGVLQAGHFASDGELVFEGSLRLSEIEADAGDPLSAAEYLIAFLNWRREPEHASDPDSVLDAFDEIIRLARLDGVERIAAIYEHEQAEFAALAEIGDPAAEIGDWRTGAPQYESLE